MDRGRPHLELRSLFRRVSRARAARGGTLAKRARGRPAGEHLHLAVRARHEDLPGLARHQHRLRKAQRAVRLLERRRSHGGARCAGRAVAGNAARGARRACRAGTATDLRRARDDHALVLARRAARPSRRIDLLVRLRAAAPALGGGARGRRCRSDHRRRLGPCAGGADDRFQARLRQHRAMVGARQRWARARRNPARRPHRLHRRRTARALRRAAQSAVSRVARADRPRAARAASHSSRSSRSSASPQARADCSARSRTT